MVVLTMLAAAAAAMAKDGGGTQVPALGPLAMEVAIAIRPKPQAKRNCQARHQEPRREARRI